MREFFHNMKLSFLLAAVLYIILGLILLIWPGVSATVFCYAFGGILLIYGVVTIVSFFLRDSRQGSFVFELFLGIVAAALGLLFLLRPVIVASVLPVILGLLSWWTAWLTSSGRWSCAGCSISAGPCPWCFPPYRRYWGW